MYIKSACLCQQIFFSGENGCNDKFFTLKIPVAFDAGWRKNP